MNSLAVILTVVFVTLKLAHVITWSWWWVLSPIWISFAIALLLFAFAGVIVAFQKGVK